MIKNKNITGLRKILLIPAIELAVFFHFLPRVFSGKLSLRRYPVFLKRLIFFLKKIHHNKFVKIGAKTRPGLYIPGFPSKAFYTACEKFTEFEKKLPCTTVLISVTSACRFNCEHCYQRYDKGKDIDIEKLVGAVKRLQDLGIVFFNIEGGEPFLVYERLKRICGVIDERSEIWVNSTGDGMELERMSELKELGLTAVMFSLHSPYPDGLNKFMKSEKAWDTLVRGVAICHKTDIPVAFNMCLQVESFYNGDYEKLMERTKEFNASIVQLIKPKTSGGWLGADIKKFTEKDILHVKDLVTRYNCHKEYRDYPSISAQIIEEDKKVFGCTAGGTDRFYINAKGDVQPCEFLNISFGNIGKTDFDAIYKRMRSYFENPGECWLCERYSDEIARLLSQEGVRILPLNEELSKKIYLNWDRGEPTELYQRIEKLLR